MADINIRSIEKKDRAQVLSMMREFYSSPLVLSNGSEEIFNADFDACLSSSPYLSGFVFEFGGELCGYAMIAKSFSTEFGKPCIWIEDIYILPSRRSLGIGKSFFDFLFKSFPDSVFRLEAEEENERAIKLYNECGFDIIPYAELIRK